MIDKYVVVELSRENNQERRRNIPFFNKGSILPAKSLSFHWNLWVFAVLPVARIPRLGISTCWSRCKLCHWPLSSSMMMMKLPTLFLLNFRAKITFHYTLLRLHLLLSSWFWSSGGKWIVKKGFFLTCLYVTITLHIYTLNRWAALVLKIVSFQICLSGLLYLAKSQWPVQAALRDKPRRETILKIMAERIKCIYLYVMWQLTINYYIPQRAL